MLLLMASAATSAPAAQATEYSFDLSEIEPSPWEFSGFGEAKFEHLSLNPEGALFPLSYGGEVPRSTLDRGTATLELAARFKHDQLTAYARVSAEAAHDAYLTESRARLLEGGVRISPSEGLSFDIGKQVQRWGKGYAWNPVGFFERPKDPNDPAQSREGFVMASADWVTSLQGPLAAVGFSPLLLPVTSSLNEDYGPTEDVNVGARLYLLVADTDIDLLWAAKGSRPQRFGLDFSRNLGSNLELHGEWARAFDVTRRELATDGTISTRQLDTDSWLVGARYLTERDVTWIAELYRNGNGFDETQLATFYSLVGSAFGPDGSTALRDRVLGLAQAGYARANPGRRYAYLRASAKDPFDWLYVSPALTTIVNLEDDSLQVTPEIVYTGWQNVELRARAVWLHGSRTSEFGAKPADRRFEVTARLYF